MLATLQGKKPAMALAAINDASHFSEFGPALTAELLAEPMAQLVDWPGSRDPGPV